MAETRCPVRVRPAVVRTFRDTYMRFIGRLLASQLILVTLQLASATPSLAQWRPGGVPIAPIGSQDLPRVTPDGEGGMYVVWRDRRSYATTNADVYIQRLTKDGLIAPGWPALGIPVAASELPEFGWLASDGLGGALVVWVELASFESKYDIYLQRILPDGSIAKGWPVDGVPVCLAPEYQYIENVGDVVGDGSGGAYVAWTDHRNVADGEIEAYVTHIAPDGSLAEGWTVDGDMLIPGQPGQRSARALLEAPDGGVYVLFGDSRGMTELGGTFALARLTPTGATAPGWPLDGLPLLLGGTANEYAELVSDGAGGAIASWNDFRNGVPMPGFEFDYDIYAQHVFADGTLDSRWPREGTPVCDDPGPQYLFTMAADGEGGAIFAWEDARSDAYWQPFAQRILPDGAVAPGWPENGKLLSGTMANQFAAFVVPDGSGGLFAFWEQSPTGIGEVGLQHVLASGQRAPGWPENGLAIGSNVSHDYDPYPVSDGKGGALLAYTHATEAASLIFAQRISGDGPVSTRVSFIAADIRDGTVALRWHIADAMGLSASVERLSIGRGEWSVRGAPSIEGRDILKFVDANLAPGRYDYRLRVFDGSGSQLSEVVELVVPGATVLELAGFRPNPALGSARIHFALPDDRPASIQVVDLRGRRVFQRDVGSLGPGNHSIPVEGTGFASGVYWIRLIHPERTLTVRGVVAR